MRAEGVGGSEDWLFEVIEVSLPDAEAEVVDSQEDIWVEWGSLKGENWAGILLTVVLLHNIFRDLGLTITTSNWLDAPVDPDKITFI